MSWWSSLFNSTPNAAPAIPLAPQPFHVQAEEQLDAIKDFIFAASNIISPAVISELRNIDDILRPLLSYIADKPLAAEEEYEVKAILTDYIPTPLNIFLKHHPDEQKDGDAADLLLLSQYAKVEASVKDLSDKVYSNVTTSLETHSLFMQDRFN